jgi:peptidoglycan/LPS O-acetylase OafA/YrhL
MTAKKIISGKSKNILKHASYRPDIDGLRAVAVLAVLIYHAFPGRLPGGFVGVDIFFVISGYLISGIIFSELAGNHFSFLHFYERRIRRIFPSLLVVLAACGVAGWVVLLADEYAQLGKHAAAGAGFVLNLVLWSESGYFDNLVDTKPLLHLWSLGVEEQFYIFWPLILGLAWKKKFNLLGMTIAIGAISFVLNLYQTQSDVTTAFYSPLTRFWELQVGAVVAWWLKSKPISKDGAHSAVVKNIAAVVGLFLILCALFLINKERDFPGGWALLPVVGAALLILAGPCGWINHFLLSNRLMVGVGLISYPLYLWHWPLLSFARILENQTPTGIVRLTLVGLSFVLAWATYTFIEKPIRHSSSNRNLILYMLVMAMVAVGAAGYWVFRSHGVQYRQVVIDSAQTAQYLNIDSPPLTPCSEGLDDVSVKSLALQFCKRYSSASPKKTILLWGDSSTVSLLPVFTTIAKERNYAVINISHLSCPPILQARKSAFTFEGSKNYCADGTTQGEVLKLIARLKPDLIVVAAAWAVYGNKEFLTDTENEVADQSSTNRVFLSRLPETLDRLSEIAKVLVFKSWPYMPKKPGIRVVDLVGVSKIEVTVLQKEFDENTRLINQVFDGLSNRGFRLYAPANKLCDGTVCHTEVEGVLFYEDTYHLSSQGVMHFKDDVELILSESLE